MSKQNKSSAVKQKKSGWFTAVFLGVFFVAGIGAFIATAVVPAWYWLQASQWQAVPASIEVIDLVTHRGSDSTTYSVEGRYQYQAGGQNYVSHDISLYSGSDNIGSYWQDLYQRLQHQQSLGQVVAWVNPENPHQAVLDRSYRWPKLLFGLIFMGMFCGISGLIGWLLWRAQDQQKATQALVAGATTAGISSDDKTAFVVLMGLGGVFIAFGLPVSGLALSDGLPRGNYAVLLGLLFPAVGALVFYQGYGRLLQWRKVGPTPFFPDPLPGCAGGQVGGWFEMSRGHFTATPDAELRCVHVYSTGSGKHSTTHRDLLWHQKQALINSDGRRWRALFDVPGSAPVSNATGYRGSVHWELHCQGNLQLASGEVLAFSRQWTVPVDAGVAMSDWQPSSAVLEQREHQRHKAADSSVLA